MVIWRAIGRSASRWSRWPFHLAPIDLLTACSEQHTQFVRRTDISSVFGLWIQIEPLPHLTNHLILKKTHRKIPLFAINDNSVIQGWLLLCLRRWSHSRAMEIRRTL